MFMAAIRPCSTAVGWIACTDQPPMKSGPWATSPAAKIPSTLLCSCLSTSTPKSVSTPLPSRKSMLGRTPVATTTTEASTGSPLSSITRRVFGSRPVGSIAETPVMCSTYGLRYMVERSCPCPGIQSTINTMLGIASTSVFKMKLSGADNCKSESSLDAVTGAAYHEVTESHPNWTGAVTNRTHLFVIIRN